MQLQWTDALAIGIEDIDRHHRQLFEIINELHDAIDANLTESVIGDILLRLTDYVGYHFECEEQIMRSLGFPEIETHQVEYNNLLTKLGYLIYEYETKSGGIANSMLDYLQNLVITHVTTEDAKIGRFLDPERDRHGTVDPGATMVGQTP